MSMLTPILSPVEVKAYLSKGERFIKWDDDTSLASPVILRVDPKGYYMYWTFQSKEIEFVELTSIRDTRYGKYAKIPKSQKLREVFNLDFPENNFLAKTLTVVTGTDMVDLTFHNFVSYRENVSKDWASDILTLVTYPLLTNASRYTFFDKIHVKLKLQLNAEGKIPVRNIFQIFPADKKRVEQALTSCHLAKGKNDSINPEDFPESVFRTFLMHLCPRPEIDEIFTSYHSKAKPYMTKDHLTKFINLKQRDSRLNELLFPPAKHEQVQLLIEKYEPSVINVQRGQLSPEGMVWFLCGSENSIVAVEKLPVNQDMTQPLSHYFINSSHNTYLTAGQFSGVSSPEMYRQTLLSGCRCVELDCWKGKPPDEEPIITHGFTMTTEILFKDVIEAIAESAFKTSPYPVILSFENHVDSAKQQAKMADYCRSIFGDMLLTDILEKYPLKPGSPLPSPQELFGKILIKNKKNQSFISPEKKAQTSDATSADPTNLSEKPDEGTEEDAVKETENEETAENLNEEEMKQMQSDEGTAGLEATAYEEMSSLVNYIQPIKFDSFEVSAQKNQSYVISSFVETKAYDLLTKFPVQFVEYNKRQMSRIYPKGTRMDSSNYMPQMFWNAGCQMVALNFQTMDVAMQHNMAIFEFNGSSGYILKHEFMRRADKQFDPFTVDRIDVVVANTLSITVLSGQFLSDKTVKTYVEVELFGLPGDPKRKYKTKLTPTANSINPVFKEEPFVFEKILMPEIASLRIVAYEEGGKFIGHRIIPIDVIRSGFHHICLRSESNMALTMPSLFVYVEVKDYVPDTWAELTHALSNPTKFFNPNEKKSIKLKDGASLSEEKSIANQANGNTGSKKLVQNGPSGSVRKGTQEPVREAEEPQTADQDELQKQKSFLKIQKKQEKELKDLERKGMKRREEIVQKYASAFSTMHSQNNKKKCCTSRENKKKRSIPEDDYGAVWGAGEIPGKGDPKVLELKEKMEQELTRAGEEHYESIWKKKEQHSIEQTAKLMELAQERQAAELKTLKDTAYSDTKQMKKKLEVKRIERLESVSNNTMDKAAQERLKKEMNNSHIQEVVQVLQMLSDKWDNQQKKLEEKQAEGLQKIRNNGEQAQKTFQAEYEEKLTNLGTEVSDSVHSCMVSLFPVEAAIVKKDTQNCAMNKWEFLFAKTDLGESLAKKEATNVEDMTQKAMDEISSEDPVVAKTTTEDLSDNDTTTMALAKSAQVETKDETAKLIPEESSH
ncbi:1-phosphatidylinositol 4,5-bisphosphate phosphodiesterase beta-2 [Pelobates cultripes]|uniref:1-phosphatidylinositol 4,5-bisphosphate phosphodiesterase n=1 Tax=Pelobates cultripes TaxID=61616 RepID=A0AAD1TQC4_PELCU|nr:1-phosphatidylinositol 4,5-bisphosphate phosphodiesterase beta-2 [Pelobates cultripes]